MPIRRLTVRREALSDLTRSELAGVPGASGTGCVSAAYCGATNSLVEDCWSLNCTNGPCGSDFQECMTGLHCG